MIFRATGINNAMTVATASTKPASEAEEQRSREEGNGEGKEGKKWNVFTFDRNGWHRRP